MMMGDGMKPNPKILVSCPKCQKLVTKRCLKNHLKIHEEREERRCEICSKVYKNINGYISHKNEDHPKFPRLPHKCQKCGKNFNRKSYMKEHQELHCPQGVKRRLTCHLCGKPVIPYRYNSHIRLCSGTGTKDFSCYFCHKRFSRSANLQVHLQVHIKEKPYSCKHCPYMSAHNSSLWRHELTMHGERCKHFVCYFCNKRCNYRHSVYNHIKGYHLKEKGYQCLKCPKRFGTQQSLKHHIKTGGRTEEERKQHGVSTGTNAVHESLRYFCYFCGTSAKSNQSLSIHMIKYHVKETSFRCKFHLCSYRSHNPHLRQLHKMTHANSVNRAKPRKRRTSKKTMGCNVCGKILRSVNYNCHVQACSAGRRELRFQCYFCQTVFPKWTNFHRHVLAIHTKERPYSCQTCGFRSAYSNAVKIHERTHHPSSSGDIIACYFCGKNNFQTHYHLNQHLKHHHLAEKAYRCEKCPRRFSTQTFLRKHGMTGGKTEEARRQHGLPNAFVECPKCFKFMKPQNIPAHLKTVHEKKPRTRNCPICYKIVNHNQIGSHMKISHDDPDNRQKYTCDECGATLSTREGLNNHKKNHGTRIRITCPQCGVKVFPQWYNEHMRQAHGPPRYICYFCGTRFKRNDKLCSHILGHHVKEKV